MERQYFISHNFYCPGKSSCVVRALSNVIINYSNRLIAANAKVKQTVIDKCDRLD